MTDEDFDRERQRRDEIRSQRKKQFQIENQVGDIVEKSLNRKLGDVVEGSQQSAPINQSLEGSAVAPGNNVQQNQGLFRNLLGVPVDSEEFQL